MRRADSIAQRTFTSGHSRFSYWYPVLPWSQCPETRSESDPVEGSVEAHGYLLVRKVNQ